MIAWHTAQVWGLTDKISRDDLFAFVKSYVKFTSKIFNFSSTSSTSVHEINIYISQSWLNCFCFVFVFCFFTFDSCLFLLEEWQNMMITVLRGVNGYFRSGYVIFHIIGMLWNKGKISHYWWFTFFLIIYSCSFKSYMLN